MDIPVTLITCTGDRPEAFALCEKWMNRQTIQGFEWIVVDDGKEPTTCRFCQQYHRGTPGRSARESFRSNMQVALAHAKNSMILFIEDDDWYSPVYIEKMQALLQGRWIAGECLAKYYNVQQRCWKRFDNRQHASLCQTGINGREAKALALKYLISSDRPETLDGGLWRRSGIEESRKHLSPVSTLCVGMKGLPGRSGLGDYGHRTTSEYTGDPDLEILSKWVGEDAEEYRKFLCPS